MAKYEDLSRRALIKLGHDFDSLNDGTLQKFLDHNEDLYEGIRPVEMIVEGWDKGIQTIFGHKYTVCDSLNRESDSLITKVGNTLATAASNVIVAGANHLVKML